MPLRIACSLASDQLPEREAELAALGQSLLTVEAEGGRAVLGFAVGERPRLERLVRAESACCPFFAFELAERDRLIELRVSAPAGAESAVQALVAGFVAGWGSAQQSSPA